jgi:hypothetical protein
MLIEHKAVSQRKIGISEFDLEPNDWLGGYQAMPL